MPKLPKGKIVPIVLVVAGAITIFSFVINTKDDLNHRLSNVPRGRFSNAYYPMRRAGVRVR